MKKRLLATVLAVAMMGTLAACGNGTKTDSAGNDANSSKTEQVSSEAEQSGTDDSLQRVLDAGVLSVGAEGNWEPYVYNQDGTGELDGFEVQMAAEIAKRLGVKVDEADNIVGDSFDGVIAGLDAERYDVVICGVCPTPERKEKYNMSDPYGEQLIALVVKGDNDTIKGFDDLKGKTSANSLSSSSGNIARSYGAELTEASLEQGMLLIQQGRADCTINDAASINAYMKANPDADVKIAAYYEPENEYEIQSSVMCRKEDKALCDAINKAIHEIIPDGTAKKLAEQYFGEDFASNVSLYK